MRLPKQLAPHKSGVHRVAAIALYRALLSQCARAPLSPKVRDDLRNITRNRFRANRYNGSEPKLKVYFEAGYEAIDHLDAAVAGDAKSAAYLTKLATEVAPAWMKKAPLSPAARLARNTKAKGESSLRAVDLDMLPSVHVARDMRRVAEMEASEEPLLPEAPPGSVFARPLPKSMLRGTRRVPQLISANWIPMLRMKKPQPPALSAYITSRLRVRQSKHDRKQRLASENDTALAEDQWDQIIHDVMRQERCGKADRAPSEPSWTVETTAALSTVEDAIFAEKQKNIRVAAAMHIIVQREQALYDKERAELLDARKRRSAERKDRREEVEQLKNLKLEDVDLDKILEIPEDVAAQTEREDDIEKATYDILGIGLKERGILKTAGEVPGSDKNHSKWLRDMRSSSAGSPGPTNKKTSRTASG